MRKSLIILLTTILSFNSYSQINFEPGYFITNSNEKVDCLIRNMDWRSNPTDFDYKLSESTEIKKADISSVKEFGITTVSKYVRKTVEIDRSSENYDDMTYNKSPVFKEENLFLKVLVEGKASLFEYTDRNLSKYFFSIDSSEVEQLVYKSYRAPGIGIGKNNMYRQQLWNALKCPSFTIKAIEKLRYSQNDLVRLLKDYNKCNDYEYSDFTGKQKRKFFHLSIRPGLNSSSLSMYDPNSSSSRNAEFDSELGFRIGIEAEFIMPFNKNKWAILVEPTYQYYKSETQGRSGLSSVDYKSIEFPFGIRHYFFLNDKSKIFINALFVVDFSINSNLDILNKSSPEIKSGSNFAFGVGYKYNNRFSLELRYLTARDLVEDYIYWTSKYETTSVILGYTLF